MVEEKITKSDFKILFEIEFLNINNVKSLVGRIANDEETLRKRLDNLETQGIISSDAHGLYSLTEKGKKIWNDDKYMDWKLELGY